MTSPVRLVTCLYFQQIRQAVRVSSTLLVELEALFYIPVTNCNVSWAYD